MVLGRPRADALKYFQYMPPVAIDALWTWGERRLEPETVYAYYASAWLWFHFLRNRHHERFAAFWSALVGDHEAREAWAASFGDLPPERLAEELKHYLDGGEYVALFYPTVERGPAVREETLTPAAVHLARAQLFAFAPKDRTAQERATLMRAELRPPSPSTPTRSRRAAGSSVWSLTRRAASLRPRSERAHPKSVDAWVALAAALRVNGEGDGLEEALQRARALGADDPYVLRELARAQAVGGEPRKRSPPSARRRHSRRGTPGCRRARAAAEAGTGDCRQALVWERQALNALEQTPSSSSREELGAFLADHLRDCR